MNLGGERSNRLQNTHIPSSRDITKYLLSNSHKTTLDLESTPGVTLPLEVKYENRRGQ